MNSTFSAFFYAFCLPKFWDSISQLCCVFFAAFFIAMLSSTASHAKLVEEVIKVPVVVKNNYGKEVAQDIVVTVFYESTAPKPYPVLVFGHGRIADADGRAAVGRIRESANSRWLTQLGFMVAVPTRVGYGASGGEDMEDTGTCQRMNYPPGFAAAAEQMLKVPEALRQRTDTAKDRAVILGQSFGGGTAITVAALNPLNVQAAINFAGGSGGKPEGSPQKPCAASSLERMFASYSKTARTPTLWVYTENDMFFGPKLPKECFDAFKAAGSTGEFALFPVNGNDGHGLFVQAPDVWKPRVLEFLKANGYPALVAPEAPAKP